MDEQIRNLPDSYFELVDQDQLADGALPTTPIGFFKDAFLRFKKNKVSMFSFWMIVFIIILSVIAPFFNRYSYVQQHTQLRDMPPRIPVLEKLGIADGTRVLTNRRKANIENPDLFPPASVLEVFNHRVVNGVEVVDAVIDMYSYRNAKDVYFWFGSDYLGRDLFTRLFWGTRMSLLIAFFAVITNIIIGTVYGAISGYYGGTTDMLMMRITEILAGIPYLVVVMLFILLFGTGMFSIIFALTVTGWIGTARLVRAQFYRFKGREYVLAARTLGVPDRTLIFRHILPNSVGPIITRAMIAIPGAIFSESFLAFIGLGLQAPRPSIGILLSDGQKVLLQYPYQTLFPAVLISVLMISFNLFANGLRDSLDPTKRGEE
jgi:oligopeptide transport system permease protein